MLVARWCIRRNIVHKAEDKWDVQIHISRTRKGHKCWRLHFLRNFLCRRLQSTQVFACCDVQLSVLLGPKALREAFQIQTCFAHFQNIQPVGTPKVSTKLSEDNPDQVWSTVQIMTSHIHIARPTSLRQRNRSAVKQWVTGSNPAFLQLRHFCNWFLGIKDWWQDTEPEWQLKSITNTSKGYLNI